MKIAGYEFEHVGDIEPARAPDGSIQQLMPQDRYENARNVPLNRYGAGQFCRFKIPNRFRTSGVYVLTIDGEIRYVGECANLSARFNTGYGNISPKNCFKGGQETNCRLNNLVYLAAVAGERISLWFFQTTDYKAMEGALRSTLKLAWNRVWRGEAKARLYPPTSVRPARALRAELPLPRMVGEWIARTAITMSLNAPLFDEAPAGRIDPLLIALAAKEMPGKLRFAQARLACHKQLNIVGYRHLTTIYDGGGECDRRVKVMRHYQSFAQRPLPIIAVDCSCP